MMSESTLIPWPRLQLHNVVRMNFPLRHEDILNRRRHKDRLGHAPLQGTKSSLRPLSQVGLVDEQNRGGYGARLQDTRESLNIPFAIIIDE